jgi:hypothetical protein
MENLMPKKVSQFVLKEQPIHWKRAFLSGMVSSLLMMSFIDVFYLMGLTPFSFESYLGSLVLGNHTPNSWTLGFLASLLFGGVFGLFYAYCFEYTFQRASARLGIWVGVWHSLAAALAFFPFFGIIHEFLGTGVYPHFGFFGAGLGASTPLFLFVGHLLFGMCMGTFYGSVRADRVRTRLFEPGDLGPAGDPSVVTEEDDHPERLAV